MLEAAVAKSSVLDGEVAGCRWILVLFSAQQLKMDVMRADEHKIFATTKAKSMFSNVYSCCHSLDDIMRAIDVVFGGKRPFSERFLVEYVTPELTVCFRGSCDHNDSGANSVPNCNSADRHRHVFAGDVRGVSDHVRSGPSVVKCFRGVCFDRVVCMRMARWSSACGWPVVVVCMRMARGGRLHADGPWWSSACGWPVVVVCVRMARGGRLCADGPWRSSSCGWPKGSPSRLAFVLRWVRSESIVAGRVSTAWSATFP